MNALLPRAALMLLLLALPACLNEYHPEYHPETVYQYTQTVRVEEPRPATPPPAVVIYMAPPEEVAPTPPPPRPTRALVPRRQQTHAQVVMVNGSSTSVFQAAPVFVADDRATVR